jgi:N-acetylmuramic acid 6-phosphate etherase
MVLNMLSTATMVKLGYVTGNRMSNLQARNAKLRGRALRILMAETNLDEDAATGALNAAGADVRVALVMSTTGCSRSEAENALAVSKGVVRQAIKILL